MKTRCKVEYVVVKDNLWAKQRETFIDAENMQEIISEIEKEVGGEWYLLKIWERKDDEYGSYVLRISQKISRGS